MMKQIYLKDIKVGEKVTDLFLVTDKNLAVSQKGTPYLSIRLRDRTGNMEARVWENAEDLNRLFASGDIVEIRGRAVSFRNAIQLSISNIRRIDDGDIEPADYSPSTAYDIDDMFDELERIADTVTSPHLRALLQSIFRDDELVFALKRAPAAKGMHHSYIGGLLEHTLSVTKLLDKAAEHYRTISRDMLLTGGILHDIGKIYELSFKRLIDYTDQGRLIGHIVLGVELVNRKIEGIEGFPEQLALELRHILLSHHGVLEYGSPKRPKTPEAVIVNMIDDMDAKVNAFQGFIDSAGDNDSDWTPYHRLFERFIYKRSGKEEPPDSDGTPS
ncbi:MAG: HD domain-containing protein [Deltaproteobacteria bacterium]|nr:HD domain-containing protein [Deltaproteobacteria bacterium]MBN2687347.1 HD domain-containing protein [Deltaproteobacteria bacterium]